MNRLLITLLFTSISLTEIRGEAPDRDATPVAGAVRVNPTTADILYDDGRRLTLDFYGENIFRMFRDDSGGILRDPEANPPARILADHPRRPVAALHIHQDDSAVTVATAQISVRFDRRTTLMTVIDCRTGEPLLEEVEPLRMENGKTTLTLREDPQEYFYGGGVQNGRFSHKGKAIAIENQNSWTDGGVASPNPFYWSTNGYAMLWHTFGKGRYDFGLTAEGKVILTHETGYLDVFVMTGDGATPLLGAYYQLTGAPALIPKFGFYQGHLNAYNRDYWQEDNSGSGILFEDGKRYRESLKGNGGVRESLNGEKDNYQFSARAVIDRYKRYDMPLGWLLPNDGYGAGYGQEETLDGNIRNLKELTAYAHANGVEVGLWTQSDLHPKPGVDALLQRDLVKEVRDAGVRVLKTDVAWVGAGYSFGLNGITDAAHIMTYYGDNSRPFIISLDGWAGTQRYATIWSGDQTGGVWEYIRFHIPTYIGAGLSGNPFITSDMDGIFGGKNPVVNTRDYQWKTFTPMQLNMDGWGANEKYPHALGEPVASINRRYLKLKAALMPYAYSIAREAVNGGLPMIRAMFLEYPNPYTCGRATQYQYMYGPWFLVAPIYQATRADGEGNDIRNGIYLPKGEWIDYFTGAKYTGGRVINTYDAPLWKLPVFVKNGAIIPVTEPHNNVNEIDRSRRIYEIFPHKYSTFLEYDDDGVSEAYRRGAGVTTRIEAFTLPKDLAMIRVLCSQGDYEGFVREKATEFRVNVTRKPRRVLATVGNEGVKPLKGKKVTVTKNIELIEVRSKDEFLRRENVYYYDPSPRPDTFATPGVTTGMENVVRNPQLLIKLASVDITTHWMMLKIDGFAFDPADTERVTSGPLVAPQAEITVENIGAYTLRPTWNRVDHADYYEIKLNGVIFSTIKDTTLLFDGLQAETVYPFRIRAVNRDGASDWAEFSGATGRNPLEFALPDIVGETTAADQGRSLHRLFDHEEGELWHTRYNERAVPFDLTLDLKTVNRVEKLHYLPRDNAGNGTLLRGTVLYSMDRKNWTEAGAFGWERNNEVKIFTFPQSPTARYLRLNVTEAVGDYGSGKEIYVFKVPGTESYLPGDINHDKRLDENDLTSYTNYTGLRAGDADFEGYISNGDLNGNGLIDAYDISAVATQLDGDANPEQEEPEVAGTIGIHTPRRSYAKGETVEIRVRGTGLRGVNAFSFALPYSTTDYEWVDIQTPGVKEMRNLTNDRLHTNGVKALYPTFVNTGHKDTLEGDSDLLVIRLKAKRNVTFDLKATDGHLVDRKMNVHRF
jgi:hypothetical protein